MGVVSRAQVWQARSAILVPDPQLGLEVPPRMVLTAPPEFTPEEAPPVSAAEDAARLVEELESQNRELRATRDRYSRDRRALENQLRQSQKLEPIGRLASGLAHEYKNILMGIQGYSDMALAELSDSPARSYLEEIRATAKRGSALAAQLLAFCRNECVERELVNVDVAVAEASRLMRALVSESVELRLDLSAPDVQILAVSGAIEQIILNLALNASDAMPTGGQLSIQTRALCSGESKQVALYVADDGVGMDVVTRRRLFEPFFTTKPEGSGTGLGLATVQRTLTELGGTIDVESALGCGTTFRLLIPLAPEGAKDPPPSPLAPCPLTEQTILVVDDERLVLATVDHYLERARHDTLLADSARAALELATERPGGSIDILLTDVTLPGMGGAELARAVRKLHPGIRVLFMSALPRAELIREEKVDAEASTIEKPFEEEGLARALAQLVEESEPQ
jgi:two-component system, cell cycle sensor histidine kinase and response regulator CckA